jgi:hypothetical protein
MKKFASIAKMSMEKSSNGTRKTIKRTLNETIMAPIIN